MPPRIVATTPDTLAIVDGLKGAVVFRFSERISERGITDGSVLVSPRTGAVRVGRGREEIRVEVEGGWRPGVVYRVLLMPGIRDLFGNEIKEPAELVFSTGPAIAGALIAGVVTERATGRPARQAFVEATIRADSITYVTAVDSSSFYAFRHLSPGLYELVAFTDQNRNGKRDPQESASFPQQRAVNRDGDTVVVELAVVPADTTPPRLTRAEPRDSLQVRLFTDDHLDPTAAIELVQVTLRVLPDSAEVPGPHALITVDSFNARPKPKPDSARADSARADSLAADTTRRPPARTAAPVRPPAAGVAQAAAAGPFGRSTEPLPYQELVLVPAAPLAAGTKYIIEVLGLTNISGRSSGGGRVEFQMPAPRPPPPDTGAARPRAGTPGR
jgi:hypothetical protein